ncbi:helix-turn-helix domain-containing protein [Streptomyces virginiae]|uniref:helix-turn-helix domain-containing protein n=1 Tax=Streptomyces virginiae TaxID=1961 RepID=UPI0036CC41F5
MTTNDDERQVMEPDPTAAEPIAKLVGRRVRELRENAGLRQADIAQAATFLGLKWGRSSVASLEAGTRKLSAEELILMPLVMDRAGIPGDRMIRDNDVIEVSDGYSVWGRSFRRMLLTSSETMDLAARSRDRTKRFNDAVFANTPDAAKPLFHLWFNADDELKAARYCADRYGEQLMGMALWPQLDEQRSRIALDRSVRATEADRKVAAKIYAPLTILSLMAEALWGRSLEEERDARAQERVEPTDARSLQGVRGYITRDLTAELQGEWESSPPGKISSERGYTKKAFYLGWKEGITANYDDPNRLIETITHLVQLVTRVRGEALAEIPHEISQVLGDDKA